MIENIDNWLQNFPFIYENLKLIGVLLVAYTSYLITKKIILPSLRRIISKTKNKYDDIFLNNVLLTRISYLAPLIVINAFTYIIPSIDQQLHKITQVLLTLVILIIVGTAITAFNDVYETTDKHKQRPIKGYLQIIKIIIYIFGGILIVGLVTGQNPWELIAGIGALTAVIILVFKDTILSFVASIQIASYDLIRVGDWIEIPEHGIDGDIMDIALHTVKVRNFDKTISVFPTNKLTSVSFKNWRGMEETGGRRIKRSILIDQSSVKFCSEKMIERFKEIKILKEYLDDKLQEINNENKKLKKHELISLNGRQITNIGTFRQYLKRYLNNRNDINKNLTFLVRQLSPTSVGIPIEIYVFTTTTAWIAFEEIQADIFDHIFAIISEFDLKVFQHPTGSDFQKLSGKNSELNQIKES